MIFEVTCCWKTLGYPMATTVKLPEVGDLGPPHFDAIYALDQNCRFTRTLAPKSEIIRDCVQRPGGDAIEKPYPSLPEPCCTDPTVSVRTPLF